MDVEREIAVHSYQQEVTKNRIAVTKNFLNGPWYSQWKMKKIVIRLPNAFSVFEELDLEYKATPVVCSMCSNHKIVRLDES